jgi:uncharacterized cupredoxin-like copper-binding protein
VPLALSTGHTVGLGVAAAVFIIFALASSFLFPRFDPQWPGRLLPAFIVVALVFFFGMLAAVEVFGAEEPEHGEAAPVAEAPTTTEATTTAATTTQAATTTAATTTTAPKPTQQASTAKATETEFKIALPSTALKAGKITFDVKNDGKIEHDLAIKGMTEKTPLIKPGGSAKLTVTLKAGKYELYCSVPGHESAGMKLEVTVS